MADATTNTTQHIIIIIAIILVAGFLSGLTNLLIKDEKFQWKNFWGTSLLGICASICVPLFLQIMSNSILDLPTENNTFHQKNYFIFAGFCVLASLFSKRFLSDLYAKVNKLGEDVNDVQKTIGDIEDTNTEKDDDEIRQCFDKEEKTDDKTVLEAFFKSKYTYRTIKGIAKETKLDEGKVSSILASLEKEKKVASKRKRDNKLLWNLTL
ncbi:hypothetical protein FACS189434_07730 [Bacteroidia bacterium]|nr:hypothetical protein FACS189434_07730 [Bacteroidia bacterium]